MGCAKGDEHCRWILAPMAQGHLLDTVFILAGIIVILLSTGLAIRTFMIPNEAPPVINRSIFRITQTIFAGLARFSRNEARRHSVLSLYAPVSLLAVLAAILSLIGLGYTLAYYGVGVKPFTRAFLFSGSALSTLGFESPGNNFWVIILSSAEALTVATVVALLIGYLPNIYSSYQAREQAVRTLDDLTGTPPDGMKVIESYVESYGANRLGELWQNWLTWFDSLGTAGSTLSGELYLRSSRWDRSWVCTAGAMLDAAALADSCLDLTTNPAATHLVRSGSKALRLVLQPLHLRCPEQPTWPQTAINVTQVEFNEAYDHFQQIGLPVKADKQAAWQAFAQQRVQYECQLMAMVRLKNPPRGARWTTDRTEGKRALALPVFGPKSIGCDPSKETCHDPVA